MTTDFISLNLAWAFEADDTAFLNWESLSQYLELLHTRHVECDEFYQFDFLNPVMSHDATANRRPASPSSSGRSTPVPRAARRTAEDGLYRADKSLKRYAATIERALATWEVAPGEWADYIAFLGRLLKAIQTHARDAQILPHSNSIASRLSQCLNPALPSGVHQKSLEIYSYIFSAFGDDYVSGHLHEFLPGLAAIPSFASITVRPAFYSLFEEHIVSFSPHELRPALKSLVLGLLPALEEENGEDFERAFNILQSLEVSFAPDVDSNPTSHYNGYFWQCLFLSVISSPSRRQGALNYLTRRLPKFTIDAAISEGSKDISAAAEVVITPEPGLLLRCFICGLSDSHILIQRGFLDILVTHLPLNSSVLQQRISTEEFERLVSAAVLVLTRKDMSLNRRLWTWFLGPEQKDSANFSRVAAQDREPGQQLGYFSNFGKPVLQQSILKMFQASEASPAMRMKPFRISLSLMDRWEIGGSIVPEVFMPAMRSLYEYNLVAPSKDVAEVLRSANEFFDGIEADLIWSSLTDSLQCFFQDTQSNLSELELFKWIVTNFNINEAEMATLHIPYAALYLLIGLNHMTLTEKGRPEILVVASQLLETVPAGIARSSHVQNGSTLQLSHTITDDAIQFAIMDYYRNDVDSTGKSPIPFQPAQALQLLASRSVSILEKGLKFIDSALFSQTTGFLIMLRSKHVECLAPETAHLKSVLITSFPLVMNNAKAVPFNMLAATISLMAAFKTTEAANSFFSDTEISQLTPLLLSGIWQFLSPERPKYNVEASKVLWQLDGLAQSDDHVDAAISRLIREPDSGVYSVETIRQFAVLWNHSISAQGARPRAVRRDNATIESSDVKHQERCLKVLENPLLLTLDALCERDSRASAAVRNWLHALPSLEQVFHILLRRLSDFRSTKNSLEPDYRHYKRLRDANLRDLSYTLETFYHVLLDASQWTWQSLARPVISDEPNVEERDGFRLLIDTCTTILFDKRGSTPLNVHVVRLLNLLLSSPGAKDLKSLELDILLMDRLHISISEDDGNIQSDMLKLCQLALRIRSSNDTQDPGTTKPARESFNSNTNRSSIALSVRPSTSATTSNTAKNLPPQLVKCICLGFSSPSARYDLNQWLGFLAEVLLEFTDAIFANLLPLVECFCVELNKTHGEIVALSRTGSDPVVNAPEAVAMGLMEGLEMILDRAYGYLLNETTTDPIMKENEVHSSFLSNVTSGVFKSEGIHARTITSKSRLAVILAFQDSIRVTMRMWLWANQTMNSDDFDADCSATTAYTALRVRNRTRHMLEQIFSVEPLESLEVLIAHWRFATEDAVAAAGINLVHVMQVSKPKVVVPATLDALGSRTSPPSVPATHRSSLTIDLVPSDIAAFLEAYLGSTEDDAIDEIWQDCVAFSKDVLANPLPYQQILPNLLSIVVLLAEKLNNTNFGEQKKMRRELGDIFQKLLTATFTVFPPGSLTDTTSGDRMDISDHGSRQARIAHSMDPIPILNRVISKIDLILDTPERITASVNTITASLLAPTLHARAFPRNVNDDFLAMLFQMIRKAPLAKAWKKEVSDAFFDRRLFATSAEALQRGWFPVLQQWSLHDKERMLEILNRLQPPSTAGIMFGVGASAARLEADRKTQFNLRRICILLLASPEDRHITHAGLIGAKIAELFDASASSSPSEAIRPELFMLCRALVLSLSSLHLSLFWPIFNEKIQAALTSLLPSTHDSSDFGNLSLLQACKLLDLLVALSPDEFQLHEWLYISDTIDAVYRPSAWTGSSLTDQIAEALASMSTANDSVLPTTVMLKATRKRRTLLGNDIAVDNDDIRALPKEDFVRATLRPFLSQLSIHAYEGVYSMDSADVDEMKSDLVADLLDLGSIVDST